MPNSTLVVLINFMNVEHSTNERVTEGPDEVSTAHGKQHGRE